MTRLGALILFVGFLAELPSASGQNSMLMQHMQQLGAGSATEMPRGAPEDPRELVRLPEPMQEHMLGNMRDHLATLNEIIGDVASARR